MFTRWLSRSPALRAALAIVLLAAVGYMPTASAVPAFARQTHQPCAACHIGGFGPQLTPFGRLFKLGGYTMKAGSQSNLPLSVMLVESYTHTATSQPSPPANGFHNNNNLEMQQASIFVAGRLSEHMGVLGQATYSENGGLLGWDNTDVRYARTTMWNGHTLMWGISANNNPTVSDVFNTAPAWQYPYMSANLAYGPPATPVLYGGFGQQVIGVTGYSLIDNHWYVEGGAYRSLSPAFLNDINIGYGGRISGLAPYARLAYTSPVKGGDFEIGTTFFNVHRGLPGTDANGNPYAIPGPTDNFRDFGVDGSYQFLGTGKHIFTANASYIHEQQRLYATYASGGSSNLGNSVNALNLNGAYWYENTWGATLGLFRNTGTADAILYGSVNGSPDTNGGIVELNWNPFGKATSFDEPWINLRVGLQYTFYSKFEGAKNNYDGTGRNASDNNTTYLYLWTAF